MSEEPYTYEDLLIAREAGYCEGWDAGYNEGYCDGKNDAEHSENKKEGDNFGLLDL